ncbi:TraR/DksA family transcriptional regulator [bacterium]|nr:MAG: TraR/DksA family transcriptional regulator [bacterium]
MEHEGGSDGPEFRPMMTNVIKELTDKQIVELHQLLLDIQDNLESLLASVQESARPVDLDQPIGRVTRIDAIANQSMAKASRQNNEIRLRQVRTALTALGDGEYGYCRQCGGSIGYPRLKARPETSFCLHCQSEAEQGR